MFTLFFSVLFSFLSCTRPPLFFPLHRHWILPRHRRCLSCGSIWCFGQYNGVVRLGFHDTLWIMGRTFNCDLVFGLVDQCCLGRGGMGHQISIVFVGFVSGFFVFLFHWYIHSTHTARICFCWVQLYKFINQHPTQFSWDGNMDHIVFSLFPRFHWYYGRC